MKKIFALLLVSIVITFSACQKEARTSLVPDQQSAAAKKDGEIKYGIMVSMNVSVDPYNWGFDEYNTKYFVVNTAYVVQANSRDSLSLFFDGFWVKTLQVSKTKDENTDTYNGWYTAGEHTLQVMADDKKTLFEKKFTID